MNWYLAIVLGIMIVVYSIPLTFILGVALFYTEDNSDDEDC